MSVRSRVYERVIELAGHCPLAALTSGDLCGASMEQIENKSLRRCLGEGNHRMLISDDGWLPNGFEI
jgi:hypothetical protein